MELEGKKSTFYIKRKCKWAWQNFNYNKKSPPAAAEVQAEKNADFTEEEAPAAEREGYTFDRWYTDAACTVVYLFDSPVNSDLTLYAGWKEDGKTDFDFTYDLNYYGLAVQKYTQAVESGETARELSFTPERDEFEFGGWYMNEDCTNEFDKTAALSADTTVYAQWIKTQAGSSE